jgi:hypothetical protein
MHTLESAADAQKNDAGCICSKAAHLEKIKGKTFIPPQGHTI